MDIWNTHATPDLLNSRGGDTLVRALGILFTEVGPDYLRGTMPVDERTKQPAGVLHGGASVALAESLGSVAGWLCLDTERQTCVGIAINANHMRGVRGGIVIGTARPVHIGLTTHVWQINIRDEEGRMVCSSRLTLAVLTK